MNTKPNIKDKKIIVERYRSLHNNKLRKEVRAELEKLTGLSSKSISMYLYNGKFSNQHKEIAKNVLQDALNEQQKLLKKDGRRV